MSQDLTLMARMCNVRCWRKEQTWSAGSGNDRDWPLSDLRPALHYVYLSGWTGDDTAMTGSSGSDQNVGLDLADARLHFSLDEKYSS